MKKPKKRTGRPTRLTAEVQAKVLKVLRSGATYEAAAGKAGIGTETLKEWIRRGEGKDERPSAPIYAVFASACRAAVSEAEERWVRRISAASKVDWRAGAFLLERRHPDRYGKADRTKIEHSGSISHPAAPMDLSGYTDEELAQLEAIERAAQERANAKGQ